MSNNSLIRDLTKYIYTVGKIQVAKSNTSISISVISADKNTIELDVYFEVKSDAQSIQLGAKINFNVKKRELDDYFYDKQWKYKFQREKGRYFINFIQRVGLEQSDCASPKIRIAINDEAYNKIMKVINEKINAILAVLS
jgi:hypothetical protein